MVLETKQFGEYTISRGDPNLVYDEADFEELLAAFVEETFTPEEREEYTPIKREFLKEQLRESETVAVFLGEKLIGMGGIRILPVDSKPNDLYVELKSAIVLKAFRGKGLAKVISERENHAVERAKKEGKGCVLFFITKMKNVLEGAVRRGFVTISAKEWLRETRSGWSEEDLDEGAKGIEGFGLKVFKDDSDSFEKTREVSSVQSGINHAVTGQLTEN